MEMTILRGVVIHT
jgi:hypothetical protein